MSARGLKEWHFHVHDVNKGKLPIGVDTTGWLVVATAGTPTSPTVYTNEWATVLTPTNGIAVVSISGGQARFWTADTVTSVDIAWMTAQGLSGFRRAQAVDHAQQLQVNSGGGIVQHFSMPFQASVDTEVDTGVDMPAAKMLYVSAYVNVTTVEATETLDFGTATGEAGGDPNGFAAAASVATAGVVVGAGALLGTVSDGVAKSLVFDASAGTTLARGYLGLRYELLLG